jgi:hypothetical protein
MNICFNPALSYMVINFPLPWENDFNLIKGFLFVIREQLACLKIFCLRLVLRWKVFNLIMSEFICNLLIMFFHLAN